MQHVLPQTDAPFLGQFLREVLGTRASLASYEVLKATDDYLVLYADLGGGGGDVTVKLAGHTRSWRHHLINRRM
jgi:hypothetical protein